MILISACLVGLNCKYNGGNNYKEEILELVKKGEAIIVCPEQLGGLSTPRVPSEIININGERKVITKDGNDVTNEYNKGAMETLNLAKSLNIDKAILMSRSPSCGVGEIYDGTFSGNKIKGNGITAELLMKNGIEVISIDEYLEKK